MQIEDMTTEQIEQYLQERKVPKGELGGVMKRADEMQAGETGWIKVKKEKEGATFRLSKCADGFSLYMSTLVETNVPEQRRARRRMTAGEAVGQLKVGDRVWVSASVRRITKGEYYTFSVEFECGDKLWCAPKQQIEVEA